MGLRVRFSCRLSSGDRLGRRLYESAVGGNHCVDCV